MPLILMAGSRGGAPASAASWQLATDHFVPAKMVPVIIHPRPDADTQAYERCRRAPSAIPYRLPITLQGGAWPPYFELPTKPSGMTVGAQYGDTDYGIITWASPTVGTHSVSIRVTDQDGTVVTCDFTLEVIDRENTTYFLFLDSVGGSSSNTGAYSNPLLDMDDFYLGNKATATNASKQIFYRAGTYLVKTILPTEGADNQRVGFTTNQPKTHVGYPGEVATIDMNGAYIDQQSNTNGGLCWSGLKFINPTVTESAQVRKQFIRGVTSTMRRGLFFENTYVGASGASGGSSNSSCIMFSGSGDSSYFTISHSTFQDIQAQDFVLCYGAQYLVFEQNNVTGTIDGSDAWGVYLKANGITNITVRANTGISTGISRPLLFDSEFVGGAGEYRNNVEYCWNNYKSSNSATGGAGAGCRGIGQGDGTIGNNYGSHWSYRNNYKNPHIALVGLGAGGPFVFERDVIEHSGTYTHGIYELNNTASITKTNLDATGTSMVDATTNLLTGAARTSYLYTHGCEVG